MAEKFESLVAALDGWFEKPFDDLPAELRARVKPGRWGREDAAARRETASFWDYNNDPATEAKRRENDALIDDLYATASDIQDDERLASKRVETWADKEGVLKARERLARAKPLLAEMEQRLKAKRGDFLETEASASAHAKLNETAEQSGTAAKPWLDKNPNDPEPPGFQPWYTPARYFARQLVVQDSTLLVKRGVLAAKVVRSLEHAGFLKRGGKRPFDVATVRKALFNVELG